MNIFKIFYQGLRVSPYPLLYSLLYGYYAKHPGFKNFTNQPLLPLKDIQDDEPCYRFIFFGDIFATEAVPDVSASLAEIFSRADLIFGNLECPVIYTTQAELRRDKNGANFWSKSISEEFVMRLLNNTAINPSKLILSIANNHSQDWGDQGLIATMQFLTNHNINFVGEFIKQAPLIKTFEIKAANFNIGVLAWTNWLNHPIEKKFTKPEEFSIIQLRNIQNIKIETKYDCLIALPHWDYEYQHFTHKKTQQLAKLIADKGFNIIAGSHTHTIQPLAVLDHCYCLYSLGNMLNPGHKLSRSWSSNLGFAWEVFINKVTKNITGYIIHPFIHDPIKNQLRLFDLNDDQEYKDILSKVYKL